MISRTHVAIRYKFLRVKCGNRQASKNVLEELPDTMAADVDTFRGPQIRTNIGPARIGMNGLYQSVEITIFECPSIPCTPATGLSDSLSLWSSSQRHSALDVLIVCYGDTRSKPAISSLMTWR